MDTRKVHYSKGLLIGGGVAAQTPVDDCTHVISPLEYPPLVARSAGLLPVSSFVTPGGLPKSLWPGVREYSRGETHRAGRCGRIKDRKSARCHCLLLTMTTTKTSHRPASVASSPPLLAFFEALFWTVMAFIKEVWPALRFQARQRRKGGGEGALPHRRSSGLKLSMSPTSRTCVHHVDISPN